MPIRDPLLYEYLKITFGEDWLVDLKNSLQNHLEWRNRFFTGEEKRDKIKLLLKHLYHFVGNNSSRTDDGTRSNPTLHNCIIRKNDDAVMVCYWKRLSLEQAFLEEADIQLDFPSGAFPTEWVHYSQVNQEGVHYSQVNQEAQSEVQIPRFYELFTNIPGHWERVYESSWSIPEIAYQLTASVFANLYGYSLNLERRQFSTDSTLAIRPPVFIKNNENQRPLLHWNQSGLQTQYDFFGDSTMPTKQSTKKRTLLGLLTQIKTKWKSLITNENAYTWLWLNKILWDTLAGRAHPDRLQEEFLEACEIFEKFTGEPFVIVEIPGTGRQHVYPRCMTNRFFRLRDLLERDFLEFENESAVWELQDLYILSKRFENDKARGHILWNPEMKHWYHRNTRVGVRVHKKGPKNNNQNWQWETIWINSNKEAKELCRCSVCETLVLSKDIVHNDDIEMSTCSYCDSVGGIPEWPKNLVEAMGGYHSHRGWKFFYQRTDKEDPKEFCVGMEIEMHSRQGNTTLSAQNTALNLCNAAKNLGYKPIFYFERDGSLKEGGLEMITNPMSLNFHKKFWDKMLPVLRKEAAGWNIEDLLGASGELSYGIHMTFSRRYFTDFQLARLVKFLDYEENQAFILGLAQRNKVYSGNRLAADPHVRIREKVVIKDKKIVCSSGRYQPVNVKNNKLIELRFWRTTLNQESFMKNLEWLFAFREWARTTSYSHKALDFIKWLIQNPVHRAKYSNLFSYYTRANFPVKGSLNNKVKNPFSDIFIKNKVGQIEMFDLPQPIAQTDDVRYEGDLECV